MKNTDNDSLDKKDWYIHSTGCSQEDIILNGARMLIGNGSMGYRGTVDEASKEDMTSLIVNGLYDKYGEGWREPVNFPNPLKISLLYDDKKLTVQGNNDIQYHTQSLNFKYGLFERKSAWEKKNVSISIASERFLSMDETHLLCHSYSICPDKDCKVTLFSEIDTDVHNVYGPHFRINNTRIEELKDECGINALKYIIFVEGNTLECNIPFGIAKLLVCRTSTNNVLNGTDSVYINNGGIHIPLSLTGGCKVECVEYAAVYTGYDIKSCYTDLREECIKSAVECVKKAHEAGYTVNCSLHKERWDKIWDDGDVIIKGDPEAQKALRYSLYHLNAIAPRTDRILSIPARGLSGQTYKGAVFWDTELFMLPYFLHVEPETAKKLIQYRISTLDGARRKSAHYGFKGAFYAWESQDTGDDVCSDFNVIDVFTKRKIRTYFKDKQIHINSAIVYAICSYIDTTGDRSILYDGAFEVIIECARFYVSRSVFIPLKKRYELWDVLGPDEYHERVNNNAYTNRMALFTIDTALEYIEKIQKEADDELLLVLKKMDIREEISLMKDVSQKMYIPQVSDLLVERSTGMENIIPQFDGYFTLEDCSLDILKKRLIDPNEYWGGTGIASETQIIKQADAIILMNLFPDEYSDEIMKANFSYYISRTEHGSSLSACMYALLACQIKNTETAYSLFRKTAEVDLRGDGKQYAGLVYIGGTHPAASGGAYLSVVQGFCGLRIKNAEISLSPSLPETWEEVSFKIKVMGQMFKICVTKKEKIICRI